MREELQQKQQAGQRENLEQTKTENSLLPIELVDTSLALGETIQQVPTAAFYSSSFYLDIIYVCNEYHCDMN